MVYLLLKIFMNLKEVLFLVREAEVSALDNEGDSAIITWLGRTE